MRTKRKTMRWLLCLCIMTVVMLGGAGKVKAACNHVPVIFDVITEPSCTRTGVCRMICSKCGALLPSQTLPEKGHVTESKYLDPDCVNPGFMIKVCTVCSKEFSRISDKQPYGHNYEAVSCTQDKCSRCGDVKAGGYGHIPVENSIELYPNCTTEGVRSLKCKTCGAGLGSEKIAKTEHVSARAYVDPTCETAGYWKTYCTQCQRELSRNTDQQPLGHKYDKRVSCSEPYVCSRCEKSDPSGKAAGHYYQGGDCETPGTCRYCSAKEIRLGLSTHVFAKPMAACTDRTCTKCNKVIKATKEHMYSTSSCLVTAKCLLCGAEDPKGARGAHKYTTNDDVPLCMADRECTICGYVNKGTKKEHTRFAADMAYRLIDDPDAARYHGFGCMYCGEDIKVPHVNNLVALECRDEHVHACYDSSCPSDTCQTAFDNPAKCSYVTKYYGFNFGKNGKFAKYRMVVRNCTVCKVTRIDINLNRGNEGLYNGNDAVKDIGKLLFSSAIGDIVDDYVPGATGNKDAAHFAWELTGASYQLMNNQGKGGNYVGFVKSVENLCKKNGMMFIEYSDPAVIEYDFQDFDYTKNVPIYDLRDGHVINYNWLN